MVALEDEEGGLCVCLFVSAVRGHHGVSAIFQQSETASSAVQQTGGRTGIGGRKTHKTQQL